jgi:octaprenyl-diphosphate synthase
MILDKTTVPLQSDLARVEQTIAQALKTDNLFVQQMVHYLSRKAGKRVRPTLALLSSRYCGQTTPETIVLGAALEMLHLATLIHDDIIDHSAVRRRQKTLNFKWGNEISVLMGDYVFAASFFQMVKSLPQDVLNVLADTTNIICRGEISETFNRFNSDLTEAEYYKIIEEKTASLFAASCRTGAMLSGGTSLQVEQLYRFGLGVGMAFQIIDDTLDFVGKQSEMGKPVMRDIKEGKLTLPMICCKARASKAEQKKIKAVILKKEKKTEDFKFINTLLKKYDAINLSIRKARQFAEDARSALFLLNGGRDKSGLIQFAESLARLDR